MLEWLAVATGVELGKLVLEQVLNLGKAALEDYIKDFFKDCIQSGVTRANAEVLKKPMAEAIGFFIKRFVKELQMNDIPETSIKHHYKAAIKRFVQDKSVRPILGKAFEKDCKQIDYRQLQHIWTEQYEDTQWQFPAEEFDWRGVAKEYGYEVKGIIKANPELRSLLEIELLEDIARNTAQISPGFDLAKYRDSLQSSYGYLKLYTLDRTDRVDAIKLWSMFIEQTVREALPPMRFELPLDLKRQWQEEGELEDLSPEALERDSREYFQQPSRQVLEIVRDCQNAVILGDPGAGKSSLLQYLALDWVEGKTETLPLLIELREFALAQSENFLEFLHRGRGADWKFDQQELHQHLLEYPTLVMFDGLDEVFDRATQSTIIDDIIRFSQQYPKAQLFVTSRIIGYNPERFQHAGFRQFTIQPLNTKEIHEFIDRWYNLSMGRDPDKTRLKQRLKDAIANSKAIQNLADNPLLLTMMAILNRRQELPRDRADLYDQASRVLLYHWDVDHKRLQLPIDAIGRREKQEILRLIAYEMQRGDDGLKGNLISAERLTRVLTNYLRDQGFSEPREKANRVIQQLRERNFILCYRGADSYGFVHRTFLEYFCAVEIVNRFEKQRILKFEELRDDVFGKHWQDETWHEVLQLISGMIGEQIVGNIIDFLSEQQNEAEGFKSLFLSSECLSEVRNRSQIEQSVNKLLIKLQDLSEYGDIDRFQKGKKSTPEEVQTWRFISTIREEAIFAIGSAWKGDTNLLPWLKNFVTSSSAQYARQEAVRQIARGWTDDRETLSWLKEIAQTDETLSLPLVAVQEIAEIWKDDPSVLPWLKAHAKSNVNWLIQYAAVHELCQSWKNDPEILSWLKTYDEWDCHPNVKEQAVTGLVSILKDDPNTVPWLKYQIISHPIWAIRRAAVKSLSEIWRDDPETIYILKNYAQSDENEFVRIQAIRALAKGWKSNAIFEFLATIAVNDPFERKYESQYNPREAVIETILAHYPTHPKTLELLCDRAINDPDYQLREWAQEELAKRKNRG